MGRSKVSESRNIFLKFSIFLKLMICIWKWIILRDLRIFFSVFFVQFLEELSFPKIAFKIYLPLNMWFVVKCFTKARRSRKRPRGSRQEHVDPFWEPRNLRQGHGGPHGGGPLNVFIVRVPDPISTRTWISMSTKSTWRSTWIWRSTR